jgi:hypothetical protein
MNGAWKLIPHQHAVKSPTIPDPPDISNNSITISPDVPIGRIELIEACIQSCRTGGNCRVCHGLTVAARFLSKEMFVFQKNHNQQGTSDEITLIVKKCGRLIRLNQCKMEENISYTIKEGTVLSILLPYYSESTFSTSSSSHLDQRNPNGDPFVIQFTLSLEKIQREENQELEDEDSPELSLPVYSDILKHNMSNSFESHLSPGILTLQESKSNLTQLDGNVNNSEEEENVLLSSLTVDQLNSLLNNCDDSEKGKFRRSVLQMAIRDGTLPILLRSTYIRLNKRN